MILTATIGGISYTPVIGTVSMVTRVRLRYARDYLTELICSLIKPAAVEKLMSFPAKIHTVIL